MLKKIRNVLEWVAILVLFTVFFSPPEARADGMHGVTVTDKEISVEVPKFCRPVKFVWEIRWEQNSENENLMKGFIYADKGTEISANPPQRGFLKVRSVWSGRETIRIPKLDAKGKEINIKRLSIAGMGDELGDFSQDNWIFILDRGIPKNISPPVRVGTWGRCK